MPDAWPRSPAVVPSTGRSTSRPVWCGTTMPCATARPAGPHRILPTRLLVVATGPGARSRPRDAVAARPCSGALDGTGPAQAGARPPRTSPARAGRGMRRSTVSGTWTCPVLSCAWTGRPTTSAASRPVFRTNCRVGAFNAIVRRATGKPLLKRCRNSFQHRPCRPARCRSPATHPCPPHAGLRGYRTLG